MYLCGPGKHNCQPFCGPEGRFYCSDSVCSLWPAPFSYLCVSVRIFCQCVLKTVCGWTSKNWLLPYACCGLHFIDTAAAACVLSFDHSTPLHIYICGEGGGITKLWPHNKIYAPWRPPTWRYLTIVAVKRKTWLCVKMIGRSAIWAPLFVLFSVPNVYLGFWSLLFLLIQYRVASCSASCFNSVSVTKC